MEWEGLLPRPLVRLLFHSTTQFNWDLVETFLTVWSLVHVNVPGPAPIVQQTDNY